jgi:hypothetical protein
MDLKEVEEDMRTAFPCTITELYQCGMKDPWPFVKEVFKDHMHKWPDLEHVYQRGILFDLKLPITLYTQGLASFRKKEYLQSLVDFQMSAQCGG